MQAKDPRWIVLAQDGRYSSVGRQREPDAEDIARIEEGLRQAGVGGWLAVISQSAYAPGVPEVVEVRPLGEPAGAFEDAKQVLLSRIAEQQASGA